jgi:DNA polymerase I-like protein with 3'-5' exonuclease and polymerase domains
VQGSAGDVMYHALARLGERLDSFPEVRPLTVVHDEVVLEVPEGQAEQVARELERAMVEGYLEVFPGADTTGLVDASVGSDWSVK